MILTNFDKYNLKFCQASVTQPLKKINVPSLTRQQITFNIEFSLIRVYEETLNMIE